MSNPTNLNEAVTQFMNGMITIFKEKNKEMKEEIKHAMILSYLAGANIMSGMMVDKIPLEEIDPVNSLKLLKFILDCNYTTESLKEEAKIAFEKYKEKEK